MLGQPEPSVEADIDAERIPGLQAQVTSAHHGVLVVVIERGLFRVRHDVATPGALIGAINLFGSVVAVAITLFGPTSPPMLAIVLGVLVEVPVMLSVCKMCISSRGL